MNRNQWIPAIGRIVCSALAALALAAAPNAPAQDTYGYKATSDVPYSYVDVAATGISVLAGTDDGTATLSLPFPFRFYGTTYNSVCVSTNGLISFNSCVPADFTNLDLTAQAPSGDAPLVAPFWMDLTFAVPAAGSVVYDTLGVAPNRRFVVQWNNALALNVPGALNFQVVLVETTNTITFQYRNVQAGSTSVSLGAAATAGIRDAGGNQNGRRLQWSYRVPVLTNSETIRFTPPAFYTTRILYDPTKPVKSGATLPVRFQLCDPNGANLSSPSIAVTAIGLAEISGNTPDVLKASGNANPDNIFRFDPTLGDGGGYIFNLNTKGLLPGAYSLSFIAGTDPSVYTVQFQVR